MLSNDIQQKIEQVYGQEIKYPRDCEGLAACITEKTGNSISSSTLKRLYGFVKTSSNPSQFTLDTIAMYIGYSDWANFEETSIKGTQETRDTETVNIQPKTGVRTKKYQILLIVSVVLTVIIFWFTWSDSSKGIKLNELKSLPEVRSGGRTIVYQNSIFYIGGADAEFVRDNNWKYDIKSDKWEVLNPMPTARAEFACARVDNLIFCFGGYLGEKEGASKKVEVYDIVNNLWQELPEMKKPLISGRAIFHGKDIYILGGSFGETKNTFLKYDTDSGDYTKLPLFKTPRNHYTMAIVDERIFVIGGMSFHNGEYVWYNYVDIFDIKTKKWSSREGMPENMARSTAITIGEEIHIIGGSNKYGNNTEGLSDKYYIYNTTDNSWKQNEKLPFKIRSAEGISIDSKLFLFGGSTDFPNPSKKVFSYELSE